MNKFFNYRQNNSGGSFDVNENVNINVIIEAANAEEANQIAESVGIYFDGVEFNEKGKKIGLDCVCCGNRWHRAYDEGDDVPMVYGEPVNEKTEGVVIHRKWVAPKA